MTGFHALSSIRWAVASADMLDGSGALLTPSEVAHLATLRHPLRRRDWLLGRLIAKRLIQELFPKGSILASDIAVWYAPSGAPEVCVRGRQTGISLSISHCDGWGFCAILGDPAEDAPRCHIGADIERVRDPGNVGGGAPLDLLTPSERAQVTAAHSKEQPALATAFWCAKEAAGKALRTGLGLNPDRFVCRLEAEHGDAAEEWKPLTVSVESQTLPGWYRILELGAGTRYAVALVVDADIPLGVDGQNGRASNV